MGPSLKNLLLSQFPILHIGYSNKSSTSLTLRLMLTIHSFFLQQQFGASTSTIPSFNVVCCVESKMCLWQSCKVCYVDYFGIFIVICPSLLIFEYKDISEK